MDLLSMRTTYRKMIFLLFPLSAGQSVVLNEVMSGSAGHFTTLGLDLPGTALSKSRFLPFFPPPAGQPAALNEEMSGSAGHFIAI
ncbi:MAG: hypothetical protein IKD85_02655 [Firmicutes bacterium]|nr:hypothetical protein [Bacillota bacterium]